MADNKSKPVHEGLSLENMISGFRTQFGEEIKPFISNQEYLGAKLLMIQMCMHLSRSSEEIMKYHSGANCIGSAIALRDLLKEGSTNLDLAVRHMEADLAQLYLAIKTGNK